ncbi:MAG: type II CAAX endopeptidase family protein [Steroidobacteraceae bacterium]
MKLSKLQALGAALALFVAVYFPAFAAVSLLRPPVQVAVPLIIGISLAVALLLIVALARSASDLARFGFRTSTPRYIALAVLLGTPLALLAGVLSHLFPAKSPIDTSGFPLWMLGLYFGAGASIQEEVIFRGLLQSFLQEQWTRSFLWFGVPVSPAVLFAATLFGVIHFDSGASVAVGAIVLGLVAGELRRRSGSLLPAVILHALFNGIALLWP